MTRARLLQAAALIGVFVVTFAVALAVFRHSDARSPAPVAPTATAVGFGPLHTGTATPRTLASSVATSSPAAASSLSAFSPTPGAAPADGGGRPAGVHLVWDPIPFPDGRRRELSAYLQLHYGDASPTLSPKVIVLHTTGDASYTHVHARYSRDAPDTGELPGLVAHFVVDADGTVYQQLALDTCERDTIGLDRVAVSVAFVQADTGVQSSERAILARTAQAVAGAKLVAWLERRYGIGDGDVIGNASANDSRYFKDLKGWRTTQSDWQAAEASDFVRLVDAVR